MKIITRVLFLLLPVFVFSSARIAAQGECLSYDPEVVSLTGTIARRTFPGPPNYESIKKGDKAETIWILRLAKPICVKKGADELSEPESNVRDVQLALEPEDYKRYKNFVGRRARVRVTGKLFHAHTAHHRTKVLLAVTSIKGS